MSHRLRVRVLATDLALALAVLATAACNLDPVAGAQDEATGPENDLLDPAGAALVFEFDGPVRFDAELAASIPTPMHWQFSDSSEASGRTIDQPVQVRGRQRAALYLEDGAARLTSLFARGDSITAFPAGVTVHTALQRLDLSANEIAGTIPAALGDLADLRILALGINHIAGPIPAELGKLVKLNQLYLAANRLTARIPVELGQLVNLKTLDLGMNALSGEIPRELGNLPRLEGLSLMCNGLTGAIPVELGNLGNLQSMMLGSNQLGGVVPVELARLTKLAGFSIRQNFFTGVAPGVVSAWTKMQALDLEGNQFDQAAVDAVLSEIWNARTTYTSADAPMRLYIGAGNAAPSGQATRPWVAPGRGNSDDDWTWVQHAECFVPATGKAMAYDLAHDVCNVGFKRWIVDHTE